MIYFDNVAGTKPDERVVAVMTEVISDGYGNPSAHFYSLGRQAYEQVNIAREHVAALINAGKDEIYFTSCGTESNNLAIKGLLRHPLNGDKKHIITSEIEHISVHKPISMMVNDGYEITYLKVDKDGFVDIDALRASIRPDTALISIQHANPEIGVIQDIPKLGKTASEFGVPFHVDAVASAGHVPIDVESFCADLLTISSQNFYGPRGASAIYVRTGTRILPIFDGGGQEIGLRSGTENVAAIVGMGKAAEIAKLEMEDYAPRMRLLGNKLQDAISDMYDYIHVTGSEKNRLPGHVSFWVEYIEGESILMWYSIKGVAVASGSACSSNILGEDEEDLEASKVLTSVGVPNDICAGSITMSMSKYTTEEDVEHVINVTPVIVDKLCEMSPAFNK